MAFMKIDLEPLRALRLLLRKLDRRRRFFLLAYSVCASALSLLDMVALGLVALVLTPLMTNQPVVLPIIGPVSPSELPPFLAAVVVLLGAKNILMLTLSWLVLRQLSVVETGLSRRIFEANINLPWAMRADKPVVDIMRAADYAVLRTVVTFMFPALGLPAMAASILAITVTLIILQPLTALTTVIFFGLVGLLMNTFVSRRASKVGQTEQSARNRMNSLLLEMLTASKEIILRNKVPEAISVVGERHEVASRSFTQYTFLSQSARPLLEIALLLGAVVIGVVNFLFGGLEASISSIALFGIAGFRLAPSIATLQSDLVAIRVALPYVTTVLTELANEDYVVQDNSQEITVGSDFFKELRLDGVSYSYPGSPDNAVLKGVSIQIPLGQRFAFVGPSGSGKSTLVDIILGLLTPTAGLVTLDNQEMSIVLKRWQQQIGYVPQQVTLFDATIAQNVALTWGDDLDELQVRKALEQAQLMRVVSELPLGIHTEVGENGMLLSGGQRQRLGIARALYARPKVLVLDEATSALDNVTESDIAHMIEEMRDSITIITIAHRLSTISSYDRICFLKDGQVEGLGTFAELVESNEDFAELAKLGSVTPN
jgi:ABC-type multidrug transport system fused ATPase/permease subunit